MAFYTNPNNPHPTDDAVSVSNNRYFQVNQIADSNGIIIDPWGSSTSSAANTNDAFGRMKASLPFTLGDYKHYPGVGYNFNDELNNGGTVTLNADRASVTLATTNNTASSAIHQSKYYHPYQPGKSQEILASFVLGSAETNVYKRIGYFDDADGLFLQQRGNGTLDFVVRSSASGIVGNEQISQEFWNVDKCNGTGDSGFNLNVTKTQLLYIDFQWLGVGRVRFGFVHDGKIIIAHEVYNSNVLPIVYISNPNLPIRAEITNDGVTNGSSMEHICSTVISSGGYSETGVDFAAANPASRTTPSAGGTSFPVMAIRLKNSFKGKPNRTSVRINNVSLSVQTESVLYKLIKVDSETDLTFNGPAVWTSADDDSSVEYCINATAYAGGSTLQAGFVPAGSSQNSLSPGTFGDISQSKKSAIMQNYDSSDSEIYVVSVQTVALGNNVVAAVSAAMQWRETY